MPIYNSGSWRATERVLVAGTFYERGQNVPLAAIIEERKRNVLIDGRYIVPEHDLHLRKTDQYGFGDSPRRHPTPGGATAKMLTDMNVWPPGPREEVAMIPLVEMDASQPTTAVEVEPEAEQPKKRRTAKSTSAQPKDDQ